MTLLDRLAAIVARIETWLGGPIYPVHDQAEWVPVGGDSKFTRCAWPDATVIRWLKGRGVTDVLNLCQERDDAGAVRAAGMIPHREMVADGDVPSDEQAARILALAQHIRTLPGARLAIHCEAGVGRTGCVCALILVKLYGCTAEAAWQNARRRNGIITPAQRGWIQALGRQP